MVNGLMVYMVVLLMDAFLKSRSPAQAGFGRTASTVNRVHHHQLFKCFYFLL